MTTDDPDDLDDGEEPSPLELQRTNDRLIDELNGCRAHDEWWTCPRCTHDRRVPGSSRWPRPRFAVYLEPRDLWVGAFVSPTSIYVCPLPTLVLRWDRTSVYPRLHDLQDPDPSTTGGDGGRDDGGRDDGGWWMCSYCAYARRGRVPTRCPTCLRCSTCLRRPSFIRRVGRGEAVRR